MIKNEKKFLEEEKLKSKLKDYIKFLTVKFIMPQLFSIKIYA